MLLYQRLSRIHLFRKMDTPKERMFVEVYPMYPPKSGMDTGVDTGKSVGITEFMKACIQCIHKYPLLIEKGIIHMYRVYMYM